jgi:hypothetical protein
MAREVEAQVSTKAHADGLLPVRDTVIGTTADTDQAATLQGWLKRTDYKSIAAASTWSLSTVGIIDTLTVIPNTTGAATVVLSDGTTAILSIPAAAHAVSAAPYTLNLGGIRSETTVGFTIVTGGSVAVVVKGAFIGTPTTA